MMKASLLVAVAMALVAAMIAGEADAHICLLVPPQRGGYNVTTPGNMACFWPEGPCGLLPAGDPVLKLVGGEGFSILLQQNLNHYNPGWPGYIDVAYAVGPNPKSGDFKLLAQISDYWPHLQAKQTNFSIPISVPNVDCPHCVIRVRYHPNKPTEPVFHNCADVSIVSSSAPPPTFGSVYGMARYASFPQLPVADLVQVDYDGSLLPVVSSIGIRSEPGGRDPAPPNQYFVAQGLTAVDVDRQLIFYVGFQSESDFTNDSRPSYLLTYNPQTGTIAQPAPIKRPDPTSQWTALTALGPDFPGKVLVVELVGPNGQGSFHYQYRFLSTSDGTVSAPQGRFPWDQTYVNVFWADYDEGNKKLYILAGDENSLFDLNVRLYTADIPSQNTTWVNVDHSQFTLTTVHVGPNGRLYSLSPGLFSGDQNAPVSYSLVTIDPTTGAVKSVGKTTDEGDYRLDYSGGVYGIGTTTDGGLLHVFKRQIDSSLVLGEVDLASGALRGATALHTGTNNAIQLLELVYLPPH